MDNPKKFYCRIVFLTYLPLLVVASIIGGCTPADLGQAEPEVTATPVPPVTITADTPTPAPLIVPPITTPHKTVVLMPDVTTSLDRIFFDQAKKRMADWIDQLVRPGQAGATIYVQLITHDSYSDRPDTTLMVIEIPPLPNDPLPPSPIPTPTPLPTATPVPDDPSAQNQFALWAKKTATAISEGATATAIAASTTAKADHAAAEKKAKDNYSQAVAEQKVRVDQAKAKVKEQTDQLRALDPPADDLWSDHWGAIERASDRLQGVSGDKYLVFASDLEMTGIQKQSANHPLDGVKIFVTFFHTEDPQEAEEREAYWTEQFKQAGATQIEFFDPARSLTIDNPLK